MDSLAHIIRFAAYRIHQSLVEKPLSISDFMPLWGDKKTSDKLMITPEMYEKIKEAHGLN